MFYLQGLSPVTQTRFCLYKEFKREMIHQSHPGQRWAKQHVSRDRALH